MNEKVMVVDDEPDIINMMKIALKLKNYSIVVASNAEECIDKLESNENPDLILLDIMLPGINGYDLYKKIKGNARFNKIKTAFFTALTQEAEIKKGLELGVDDYITKSFDPYELLDRITHIMQKRAI
jgi:DNA-binding response OmpR family regulator